jgi:hypothetical protein
MWRCEMGGRFIATIPSDLLLTVEQVEVLAGILKSAERLSAKWVGQGVDPSGYVKELVPFDCDSMGLKFLTESDYNAYRFLAANKPENAHK